MNWFEHIVNFLCYKTEEAPQSFGIFHLISVLILIFATVFICIKFKNCDEKTFRHILLICWGVFIVGEIYREIALAFSVEDGIAEWSYAWHQFPFHLCATAMYILPFIIFMKDGPVRQACLAYISTFSLFGGLAVMVYPQDVFIDTLGVSIQSMVHHGLQVVIAIFCTVHNRHRFSVKYYLKGIPVFVAVTSVAMILNEAVYAVFSANGITDSFNMFYISPHFDCTLPLLNTVYPVVPYPVFLAIYVFGFLVISGIMFFGQKLFVDLAQGRFFAHSIPHPGRLKNNAK